ncbi:4-hydroxy-2-oxovalerate aldolase [Clostridium sp. MCC353]|uniref:4-hydroxy-2-oxovalerate aldolase n=1 Tax=Clostridium sp. MCC353 TaxID=2592646 RepID=UPI001C024F4A|nr:4-hydroxy-2-oxovalerate aldolase [Clostridium sp. MCC353]MBT9779856.1 4-hydroxy-2-oxovalerate aldolase [Clostridium sp. MCC353]
MRLMDCTLRDGANVIGKGFDARLTTMMIEGLIKSNIKLIEMGNCLGLGAYEANNCISPLNDIEYLELVQPYLSQAEIGMFMGVKNAVEKYIELGARYNLHFLRIGANAGDGKMACDGIRLVKKYGMKCRYSMMKGYILSAEDLAEEAAMLESCGLDEITIMDSAGTMMPHQVYDYVSAMVKKVQIPVAFHGHNNLGLSTANALAAEEAGASVFDCGLMGMARSAGNCATELAAATFQRLGKMEDVDLYALLHFIDDELAPAMAEYGYQAPVKPIDLVYGLAGCHSSFAKLFEDTAKEKDVDLYKLITKVSAIDQKAPSAELINRVADEMKQ